MSKQTIIITVITALVFFGLGFAFANYYKSSDNIYQAGGDAANIRLAEMGCAPVAEDLKITSINGIVQEIKNNLVYLKIQPLTLLADPELNNRIIEINKNTKVYKLVEKSATQHQEEIAESMMLPKYFIDKQEISFNDVQVGQKITVVAQENIKDKKQFKAAEIIIQFMPTL